MQPYNLHYELTYGNLYLNKIHCCKPNKVFMLRKLIQKSLQCCSAFFY